MSIKPGKIRIGITNGQIPGNKNTFPPAFLLKSRLHYYSTLFNTIEVNSCFYKTPLRATYEKWANDVPGDFQFTLKLSKDVTHVAELKSDLQCINSFLDAAKGTGDKKGCILVQFPGKISLEHFNEVERIVEELNIQDPENDWRKAVEFRNDTWYIKETSELLNEFGVAMVLHDFPKGRLSSINTIADFVYMRFHGPTGNYRDSYSNEALNENALFAKDCLRSGKDVYAYFNNTAGNAFENAKYFQSLFIEQLVTV